MKLGLLLLIFTFLASLPARSETIEVYDNHGGRVADYNVQWAKHAQQGASVRIVGPVSRHAPC